VAKEQPKRVCILGTAETMGAAPFEDDGLEIWAHAMCINRKPTELKRWDLMFEMHGRHKWIGRVDELNRGGKPVIMQRHFEEVPASEPYPLDEVLQTFPRYFTNSISQMVALAIIRGYREIALFGVHLATASEYAYERPNLEYLLGHAEARGISLWIPEEAQILRANYLYGYEEQTIGPHLLGILRDAEERVDDYGKQELAARDAKQQSIGWRECARHLINTASH